MSARILVVDDDPWILRMVTATLEKRRFVVDTARDGRQALQRAEATPPDVIITDLMMPVMDGWTFVQQLRANPRLATIPVIFLTALGKDEARIRALGIGPQDYVSKPFRFDELERRVTEALHPGGTADGMTADVGSPAVAAGQPSPDAGVSGLGAPWAQPRRPTPPPPPASHAAPAPLPRPFADDDGNGRPRANTTALNGRLEQLGLSSLLVMMEMERKGGVLTLKHTGTGHIGRIFLRKGQVIHAKIDNRPELAGRESVYEMVAWEKGVFSFSAMDVDMEDTVQSSTTHLLMEGARLMDEASRDEPGI